MNRKLLWLAVWSLAATTAIAEEQTAASPSAVEAASVVHDWLELQRSGTAASPQPQPLSGPAMDRAYVRYLKGFEYAQPMYFKHDETVSK